MKKIDVAIEKFPDDRIVDNETYRSQEVYDRELRDIFDRCWLFACHESEIPEPGDFVTLRVAESPIIINRTKNGELNAMHNVCRHRGALLTDESSGHCANFRCAYHFWTYSLEGELIALPGEEAYDGTGFSKEDFGLARIRIANLFGLVFINFSDDDMTLEEWIGPEMIEILARPLKDNKMVVDQHHRHHEDINWKVFAENSRDGYHVPFVHPFFRHSSPPGDYHLFRNSHARQEVGMAFDKMDPRLADDLQKVVLPGLDPHEGFVVNIFPDLLISLRANMVSISSQELDGPTGVFMEHRVMRLEDDDAETIALRNTSFKAWVGDRVDLEDEPVFRLQQAGVRSRHVTKSVIARGADATSGQRGDDNRLRHFWVTWRKMLGVEKNSLSESERQPSEEPTR